MTSPEQLNKNNWIWTKYLCQIILCQKIEIDYKVSAEDNNKDSDKHSDIDSDTNSDKDNVKDSATDNDKNSAADSA